MPPLDGPRATLCVTRQPVKTRTLPSSIVVGIDDLDRLLARAEDRDEVVVDPERVGDVLQLLLRHLQRARGSSGAPPIRKRHARSASGLPPSTGHATSRSW